MTGRVLSIAATLFVAGAIAYRARTAGPLVAVALGASWLATQPVIVWGSAVKPDLVALALIVGAVAAADARRAALAGALAALASWTKPTEALPALALLAWFVVSDRRAALRFVAASVAALAVAMAVTHVPDAAMYEHVVTWNALDWSAAQALLLASLGLIVSAATLVACASVRPRGAIAAYLIGALGIVVLGGREGATINYLLDLVTAAWLTLASAAPRIRASALLPFAIVAQTVFAFAIVDPFGLLSGRAITTGAWASPARAAAVHALPGRLLVEDSGLLVAEGRMPDVDDLFLWSRLQDRRNDPRLLEAVRAGAFDAVVSETDLARLDAAPLFERQRWHPSLVAAVLERYRLDRSDAGLFVYRPR